MNDREKLAQLRQVSQLILDIRLFTLEQSAKARQASLDHLAELNKPSGPHDLNPVTAGEVSMRFQNWADHRRSAINITLARQTAIWTEARQDASLAFGRNAVIRKLQKE